MPLIPIHEIIIGPRHRKDMGDIPGLAKSIEEIGLLQAIGITPDKELVFGERRIKAYEFLGMTEIEARTVNVTSILEGEFAENEVRKDFTRSEQVAIAASIAELLEERQRRGRPPIENTEEKIRNPDSEFTKGERTRDFIAKRAGFGCGVTFEEAKRVVNEGSPELIKAMDEGRIAVKDANLLTRLPAEEQDKVLLKPKKEIIKTARSLAAPKIHSPNEGSPLKSRPFKDIEDISLARLSEIAHQCGTLAISQMERIPPKDPLRKEALLRVRQWIDKQLAKGGRK